MSKDVWVRQRQRLVLSCEAPISCSVLPSGLEYGKVGPVSRWHTIGVNYNMRAHVTASVPEST